MMTNNAKKARIWRVNLEKLTNCKNQGFSITGKTTETALLVLTEGEVNLTLYVCLIELKSSLKPDGKKNKKWSCLDDVAEKFQSSINKICLLLTLNNHDNPLQGYANQNIYVVFKGLLFYNRDNIDRSSPLIQELAESAGTNLLEILDNKKAHNSSKLSIVTMLDFIKKVEVKFFQNHYENENSNDTEDTIEITLHDLLA